MKKAIIFIPAFNEEDSIGSVLDAVSGIRQGLTDITVDVILVDDGCTDRTVEIARSHGIDHITHHPTNMGLGAATRTGMRKAFELGADVAIKLDADLQHDPNDIMKCVQPILDDFADIVWGSRMRGTIMYRMPLYRRWGNAFFTWLMNVLTDYKISDAQTGLMVFGRRYLSCFQILADYNPPQQILIDANSKKMRYMEVPVVFQPRNSGESFVNYKYPFRVLMAILWVMIHTSPLRVFFPVGVLFFSVAVLISVWNLVQFFLGISTMPITNYVSVFVCFLAGLQTCFFGLLADLILKK